MTKNQLIKNVGEKTAFSQQDVNLIVNAFLQEISLGLNSDNISIKDFGTFRKAIQKARIARNPSTGEQVNVPEKEVVKFKASKNILNLSDF